MVAVAPIMTNLNMTAPAITDLNHGGAIFIPLMCSTEIIVNGSLWLVPLYKIVLKWMSPILL
jgi:hypothetical protein